jgi:hypothetical protein
MRGVPEQRAAARRSAGLILTGLAGISGLLEEVATVWRRAGRYGPDSRSSPGGLQAGTRSLGDAVRVLPDAESGQVPALACSAVTRLDALSRDIAAGAAAAAGHDLGDSSLWGAIQDRLPLIGGQLWSLLSHLVASGATPLPQELLPPEPGCEGRLALAMSNAIDALPETELRRLLKLVAGLDPAAVQRAAACYTEIFCAVADVEASVAALLPIAVPGP